MTRPPPPPFKIENREQAEARAAKLTAKLLEKHGPSLASMKIKARRYQLSNGTMFLNDSKLSGYIYAVGIGHLIPFKSVRKRTRKA